MSIVIKIAFWLLRGKTIEYWVKGSGETPLFTIFIDGKPVISKRKYKHIAVVFGKN
jgi:hypothetical protein